MEARGRGGLDGDEEGGEVMRGVRFKAAYPGAQIISGVVVNVIGAADLQSLWKVAMESVMEVKGASGLVAASTRVEMRSTSLRQRGVQRLETTCADVMRGFVRSEDVRSRAAQRIVSIAATSLRAAAFLFRGTFSMSERKGWEGRCALSWPCSRLITVCGTGSSLRHGAPSHHHPIASQTRSSFRLVP